MIRIAPQETEAAAAEDPGVCKAGVPNAVAAKDSVAPFVTIHPEPGREWRVDGFFQMAWISAIAVTSGLMARLLPGRKAKVRLVERTARALFRLAGEGICVDSPGGCRPEPAVYLANRASRADPLVLAAAMPSPFLFADPAVLAALPRPLAFLLGPMRLAPIYGETSPPGGTLRQRIEHGLGAGHSVLVLADVPPGTPPLLSRFRLEAFRAVAESGSPMVSVALRGTASILGNGYRPARNLGEEHRTEETAKVTMGEPIWLPDGEQPDFAALRESVRKRIADLIAGVGSQESEVGKNPGDAFDSRS